MKLCNFKTAKALREMGYDGEYNQYVSDDGSYLSRGSLSAYDWHIPAPRLDDAAYWIREKFKLNIRINYITLNECWFYDILNIETGEYYDGGDWIYEIYDSALEAAVTKAIEIINSRNKSERESDKI